MENRHFLVAGGSHGIGFEITRRLVAEGNHVTVLSRTEGELGSLAPSVADKVTHIVFDVTSDDATSFSLPDSLSGFAYCPGSINLTPVKMTKPETMRADFELNVVGAVRLMQHALPAMKSAEHSSVVLFSTVAVGRGIAMHTPVAAAKGAVEGIARTWAAEFAPIIRVNCIAPALTDTPLSERLLANENRRKSMAEMYPLGRIGLAEDIASVAMFLLSDQSSWMTGQVIGVDGGLSHVQKV